MNLGAFDADRHRELTRALAIALDAQPDEALARAAEPLTVSVYPAGSKLPLNVRFPPRRPFMQAFAHPAALREAVRVGVPEAFEVGLEVLAALDPERAAELGEQVLALSLWPEVKDRAAFALSKSTRQEAFTALLQAVGDVGRAGFLLAQSPFAGGGEVVLRKLEASSIPTYEPAKIPSRAQWLAMPEAARAAAKAEADKAAAACSFAEVDLARSLLEYLGAKRWVPAQALIARLYAEHPSDKVRLAAGHALFGLGDQASLDLLTSLGDTNDPRQRWFAVKVAIARDPATAVERLGGDALKSATQRERVTQAFEILKLDAAAKDKSGGAPWELADPRWRDVAEHWAPDHHLGLAADGMLRRLPDATSLAPAAKTAKNGKKKNMDPKGNGGIGALALLQAGDSAGAWQKLIALGDRVREPELLDEARKVASATMRTARADLEKIVERLRTSGYRFARPNGVLLPPPPDAAAKLDEIEAEVGPMPLALRAAFEYLGVVDLAGDHPSWPKSANVKLRSVRDESETWFTDPLMIVPLDAILEDVFEQGVRKAIAFAADPYTKAGYSGGIYKVPVPCPAADAKIEDHPTGLTFLEHLRVALRNGGFAGFAAIPDAPRQYIAMLVEGCAPI